MPDPEDLRSWIAWLDERVDPSLEIPPTAESLEGSPWSSEVFDWAQEIAQLSPLARAEALYTVAGIASGSPTSVAHRFASLHFLWMLRDELRRVAGDSGVGEILRGADYPHLEEAVVDLSTALHDVVALVRANECQRDWPVIRWEISNSYLVADRERADALLRRVQDLKAIPAEQLYRLRARISFLRIFWRPASDAIEDAERASIYWPPASSSSHVALFQSFILFAFGECDQGPRELQLEERQAIRDLIADLEKARDAGVSLLIPDGMLLARAHFELGLFQNAATLYEALLNDPQLEDAWPWEGDAPGPWNIAECAALCWSRADELDNAERVIRTNLSEATDRKKALLLLARIQSEGGRFERVCETLREIESQSPDEPRDWLERAVLALGEVALSRSELLRSIDTKLHATPEVESTFRGLLESYWPAFGLLSGAAQERWLKGTYYRFLPWPSLVCSSLRADSGIQFATAVELELRARVFDGFRDKVWKVQPKTARTNEEDSFLWDFLERARPLTLGQMAHILRSAERAKGESIEKRLAGWLRSTRPQLLAQLWVLELIVPLRNDAVHGTGGPDSESDRVAKHCRSLLDVIVAAG